MKTAEYDFDLPESAIALRPADERDRSRLLVLRRSGSVDHLRFADLPSLLSAGDLLILNDSKVFPARLIATKPDGEPFEMLLVSEISEGRWNILSRGSYTGAVRLPDSTRAEIEKGAAAAFEDAPSLRERLWRIGVMPLPPYIKRPADDRDRMSYQTVYARAEGSIAAPTAGLHFTDSLLHAIRSHGVLVRSVTLHVGTGTFRPVRSETVEAHSMDEESFTLPASLMHEIEVVKKAGNRVIAVGTTSTRTLEGLASGRCRMTSVNGTISGRTDIFIHEGYRFRVIDGLITNFHLPCSTPLMLVSALSGREKLLETYRIALTMGYRFFSYGDAMLVI